MNKLLKSLIKEHLKKILKEAGVTDALPKGKYDIKKIKLQLKGRTVTNPKTKKKILVTSILSYGPFHDLWDEAKSIVQQLAKVKVKKLAGHAEFRTGQTR